jgi:cytochrome bd ubiquinol oxidase subunit II
MESELAFVWAGLIAFAVLTYIILDGFDLGVGILFPFAHGERDRDVMMNSVAPVWDGNETWLILGGGGLFAVFPLAYAVVMPALYMPIILMLLALIFRGVSFEYRWRTTRWKPGWDTAFFAGSLVAALMQGVALGALVQGIAVEDRAYSGGWWDWLTAFSVIAGIAVAIGYALLGASWLNAKTTGVLQLQMRSFARPLAFATLGFMAVVSVLTPFQDRVYFERWFAWPGVGFSLLVPLLVAGTFWLLISGLRDGKDLQPSLAALGLFVLAFIGIGISFYPFIVPPRLSIWDAAAPDASLKFVLVGTAVLIPLSLAYTAWAYWVVRGKVDPEQGYH